MEPSEKKAQTVRENKFSKLIRDNSIVLKNSLDIEHLLEKIGDARYVLLGEASHGTHEYYTWRAQISKKLIEEKGFSFIAVEGDWPDCYRLNRYIKNYEGAGKDANEVLHAFNRWPTWMWANWEIVALSEWLRKYNESLVINNKIGFYGLDVYSLWESLEAILKYLEKNDPATKQIALKALKCFEPYGDRDAQAYARATMMAPDLCHAELVELLTEIRKNIPTYNTDREAIMSAEQNAFVSLNAERYYNAMVKQGPESWNIRDHHMNDTLQRLMHFHGKHSKAIVWEHNTHIGDARATDMATEGMVNIGQLLREHHKEEGVFTLGFGSYQGTVIAGNEWSSPMREIQVPRAIAGSWEDILHQLDGEDRLVFMSDAMKEEMKNKKLGHRAIGVVYRPIIEQFGNYVPTTIPERYDAFLYLDQTSALHPLHIHPDGHQIPETFPFGV